MRCEYKNCRNEAVKSILNTNLCKRHFEIVKKELLAISRNCKRNSYRDVEYEELLDFIKNRNGKIFTTTEICQALHTSYPKIVTHLKRLQKNGLIEKITIGVYRVVD